MAWIPDAEWDAIQRVLPIVVVDVVPLDGGDPPRVGLITRATPHQGPRWNLVGGRIAFGETLGEAVRREVTSALGPAARVEVDDAMQPDYIGQYGPFERAPFSTDPRKHAVGLTYALTVTGEVAAGNEALAFQWFDLEGLPKRALWGFEQDRVAEQCLLKRGLKPEFSWEP